MHFGYVFLWAHDSRLLPYELREPVAYLVSPQHPHLVRRFGQTRFSLPDDDTSDVKLWPDGTQLWLLTARQFLRFSTSDGRLLRRLRWGDRHTLRSQSSSDTPSLSPDGREILSLESGLTFYSTRNGRQLRRFAFLSHSAHTASFDRAGNVDEVLARPPFDPAKDVDNFALSLVVSRRASDGQVLGQRQDVNGGLNGGPEIQENSDFIYTIASNDRIWKTSRARAKVR